MHKNLIAWIACFFGIGLCSQTKDVDYSTPVKSQITFLDSIKNSFVNHSTSSCIDSLWIRELTNKELFYEMESDISSFYREEDVSFELSTELLKERLKHLDEKTPFKIEYNETLERVIKSFLKNRKRSFEKLMGISEYYFPIFEQYLAKYDIPLEVKYLAIVESALNPTAKSRMGATGLWQFMYPTGKRYNLEINSFIDERSDPMKSSEAAAKYMSDLFQIFGDWDLVLASYNAGPGNVSKAIRRSKGYSNYWNIRKYLPRETQGYLPAFFATMYIFEFAKEHGIISDKTPIVLMETDTVIIKKHLTFKQISKLLDISEEEISFLNPTYKLKEVPFFSNKETYLRLPIDKIGSFTSNEEQIYAYIDYEGRNREKANYIVMDSEEKISSLKRTFHTVKNGESLGFIALKHKLTVAELKRINNLKSNLIHPGLKLKVGYQKAPTPSKRNYHTVKSGESLDLIASKYRMTVAELKRINNLKSNLIHPGFKLNVDI